jgi:hypothetical protein
MLAIPPRLGVLVRRIREPAYPCDRAYEASEHVCYTNHSASEEARVNGERRSARTNVGGAQGTRRNCPVQHLLRDLLLEALHR